MNPLIRVGLTFIGLLVIQAAFDVTVSLFVDCEADSKLADALMTLLLPISCVLVYRSIPVILGVGRPSTDMRAEQSKASGWWWKWACLCLAWMFGTAAKIGEAIRFWEIQSHWFGRAEGIVAQLSPQTRRLLVKGESLRVLASVLMLVAIYLFWREWRQFRRTAGALCRHCSYDLTGNVSGVCPECGTAIDIPLSGPGKFGT